MEDVQLRRTEIRYAHAAEDSKLCIWVRNSGRTTSAPAHDVLVSGQAIVGQVTT